jgi:transposase
MSCAQAAHGDNCQLTFRPGARSIAGSLRGATSVCSKGQPRASHSRSRTNGEAGQSIGRYHRQPEREPRGYDAGKKIKGRKRHALVDTDGRGLMLEPHPASIQDRDGGGPLLQASRRIFPFIDRVFADGGYAGRRVATAIPIIVEIVNKHLVLPRRWVVERFFAWIGRNRRLAKDFEATIASARAFLYAASIMLLSRRMARAV